MGFLLAIHAKIQDMKSFLTLVCVIIVALGFISFSPLPIEAQTSNSDMERVCDVNGVCYLTTTTTEVRDNGQVVTTRTSTPLNDTNITPPTGYASDIGGYINSVLTLVILIAALLVFGYLIWGGIQWITSGGDKGKIESARNRIFAAVIGIIILAASFAVAQLVIRFLGFDSLNDVFYNLQPLGSPNSAVQIMDTNPSTTPQPIRTETIVDVLETTLVQE